MRNRHILCYLLALGFLLGIKDGKIALWKDGEAQPRIFPYRAETLPEADQKRLEEGIRIEDGTKLAQLLEDYLS
jgi:hypothetical protein